MLARLLLGLLTLISILWIAVASYVQNQQSVQFQIEQLFGPEDKTIVFVNQPNEYTLISEAIPGKFDWNSLLNEEATKDITRIIYAEERAHALIQTNTIVTEKKLKELFNDDVKIKKNTFESADFKGNYSLTNIYIYKKIRPKQPVSWQIPPMDKNATANFITFQERNAIEVNDFYNRKESIQSFIIQDNKEKIVAPINDADIFMHVLSSQIDGYTFYAKEYLSLLDISLSKQSWMDLVESSVVITKINGQTGIYMDARPNTDIFLLNQNNIDRNSQIIAFETTSESTILSNNKTLYIANLDDHYVVSPNKSFCEEALANYKMGNILLNNTAKVDAIYSTLPRRVHTREISKEVKMAKRFVPNQVLSFWKLSTSKTEKTPVETGNSTEAKHFSIGETVRLSIVDKQGRIALYDEKNTVHYFGINGKITTLENVNNLVLPMTFVDLNDTEQLLTLLEPNNIKMYNSSGALAFQLDANPSVQFTSLPQFARVKGKDYWLVGTNNGTVYWYNTNTGKVEKQSKIVNGSTIESVNFWQSAGKHFIGARIGNHFYMTNAETNKLFRNFNVGKIVGTNVAQNDLKQVQLENGTIKIINQKGLVVHLPKIQDITTVKQLSAKNGIYLATDEKHHFVVFNINGEILINRTLQQFNIDKYAVCINPHNQHVLLTTLDDLNNQIQLFNLTDNREMNSKELKGSNSVMLACNGKTVFLYTFIDNILIRYDR